MADTILLITKDQNVLQKVRAACQRLEVGLTHQAEVQNAEEAFEAHIPDLILCDYATFAEVKEKWPRACVLIYAEPTDSEQAIAAIKNGALDYLIQPISPEELVQHIEDALRITHDVHVPAVYEDRYEGETVDQIVGQSRAMKEVYKLIGRIAPRDINVLITGESGTGKELVARAILHHSPRKDNPFLAVNCAAIPETLLESELFGHEKGAFTGADLRRIGKFEQCSGGTLFLDEVGDIPPPTQAKLLRVLQDNTFQRLGGTEVVKSNVRIVAATHQRLEDLIKERRFRQDLYYRLNVANIHIPPLRDREIDVVLIAHYFVNRYNHKLGTRVLTFSPEVLPVLLKYAWPGNVRELENAIKSALVISQGSVFQVQCLPEHIRKEAQTAAHDAVDETLETGALADGLRTLAVHLTSQSAFIGNLHRTATRMVEREIIRACLESTEGQLAPAAKMLGISRTTLRRKMADLGIQARTSIEFDG